MSLSIQVPEVSFRPGGAIARRKLTMFLLVDCSHSMSTGGKMQSLNEAVRNVLPDLKDRLCNQAGIEVQMVVMAFADTVEVQPATPLDTFTWHDLMPRVEGTQMGKLFSRVADELKSLAQERGVAPVINLLSDGEPTDDWRPGYREMASTPWGKASQRTAIAIGQSASRDMLHEFMGADPNRRPLDAMNAGQLADAIRYSTVAVGAAVSQRRSQIGEGGVGMGLPPIPASLKVGNVGQSEWL